MSALGKELHFLLDEDGALVAFQEKTASWMSVLAFSSEDKAREFLASSGSKASEIVSLASNDAASIAQLIRSVKQRAIRNLLLDLDYQSGKCWRIEFDGDRLGEASEHQFAANHHH
ncbi:MAG TPA: hypothetical protein VMA09_01305 [Candidatus Binataceae bacterium]|nr:hypothetical protein [Candidatus Binataceae bacterium]